jgi:hypothetical protein
MGKSHDRVNALKTEFFKHLQEKHPRKKREDSGQAVSE